MPHSLAQLLLRRLLLAYVSFALVITGIQMFIEYRVVRSEIVNNLKSLAATFSPGVESALWQLQEPLLNSMVHGIAANPAVVSVDISELGGDNVSASWRTSSGAPASPDLTVQQTLYHQDRNSLKPFGILRIASSGDVLTSRLEGTLWSVGVSNATLFVCLGVVLWLLARSLVVKPLVQFSDQVGALSATGQGTPIDLGPVKVGEIETLKQGFNRLMQQLAASHSRIAEQNALLQHDKAQMRCIIDSIPDLIFIKDKDGTYLGCNKAFEIFAGRKESEMVGRSDFDLFDPGTATAFRQSDLEMMKVGATRINEVSVAYPDGRSVSLETLKTLFFGTEGELLGLVGISRDITQRKALEEEQRLAALVYNNSSEAMVATDEENRIIAVNPAFTDLTGYTEDEVLGKNPKIQDSGRQDTNFIWALWKALDTTGSWKGEIRNRHKSGREFVAWLTINTIFDKEGKVHRRVALFSDITEKKKADSLIWTQANYDQLTGLPNRRLFQDRLDQEIRKAHRDQYRVAVLFIDLDRFKEVNDTLGHDVGDLLLVEAATRIKDRIREYDTLSRFGGDEFTVILPELHDASHVGNISTNIIERLSEPFVLNGQECFVSASIGIALYPDDASTVTDLVKQSDQAMYAAKNAGRGRFNFFTRALQEESELRIRLGGDLRRALKDGQLEVHYQPIIDLASGDIRKAEALLRWNHPRFGYISPAVFIPIAEDTGTIRELGDWVFLQGIRQAKHWQSKHDPAFQISINMSPVQFTGDGRSQDHWIEEINGIGLAGSSVVIEITEGLLMSTETVVPETLLKFRDAGIQVAIDDFGTGYSALSYLKKFDIDFLKIDKSFTSNLRPNAAEFALCEAIVVLAHKLGLKVVAEGVETEQQRDLLNRIGCDYAQGYLFSRPVTAEDFERLLAMNGILELSAQGCQSE
jgi:diguanylate cyclase (GGDEF)-like protein/PAS domain S-box-containing protein